MNKWLKNILAAAVIILLLWYLTSHRQELKEAVLKLTLVQLLALYVLLLLQAVSSACVVRSLLGALQTTTGLWDMFLLQNASVLLNYVPMKFGTLFRANYLKRHYGLAYAHFGTFFVYLMLLMTATAAAVGLIALATVYGISVYERKVLALIFLVALACSLSLIFIPLPTPTGSSKLGTVLRRFLSGRREIKRCKRALVVSTILLTANFIMTSVRLWIIYTGIGTQVHPAGFLVLGTLGFVVLFISLTPGALGIREAVLGCGAIALGIPLEVGILAAMIDRAVVLSYAFAVGGISSIYLWRKSPDDFKSSEVEASTDK